MPRRNHTLPSIDTITANDINISIHITYTNDKPIMTKNEQCILYPNTYTLYDPHILDNDYLLIKYLIATEKIPKEITDIIIYNTTGAFAESKNIRSLLPGPITYLKSNQYIIPGPLEYNAAIYTLQNLTAALLLNICHLGQGVPAGSQWQYPLHELGSNPNKMNNLIKQITHDQLSLPEELLQPINLPKWKQKVIWQNGASSRYPQNTTIGMKEELVFNTPSYYLTKDQEKTGMLLLHKSIVPVDEKQNQLRNSYATIYKQLIAIQSILKRYSWNLNIVEENQLPKTIQEDNLTEKLHITGADYAIELYLDGVPIDDILA